MTKNKALQPHSSTTQEMIAVVVGAVLGAVVSIALVMVAVDQVILV